MNDYTIDNETMDLGNGYKAEIEIFQDEFMGEPWKEHDGHGVVSEWETRSKAPYERILCSDRNSHRFYDVQETMKIAIRDGWDAPPYQQGTKGEQAARAVARDFESLRAWCNDEWCWVTSHVTVTRNDQEVGEDYLGGVESCGDYWKEEGERMAREIVKQDKAERRERKACEQRDIVTA